jgi:hypothetical protein
VLGNDGRFIMRRKKSRPPGSRSRASFPLCVYADVLGLEVVMNQGWIATYASTEAMAPQISFASQGGSGTPVPALSIEVADW